MTSDRDTGLTQLAAAARLAIAGPNEVPGVATRPLSGFARGVRAASEAAGSSARVARRTAAGLPARALDILPIAFVLLLCAVPVALP